VLSRPSRCRFPYHLPSTRRLKPARARLHGHLATHFPGYHGLDAAIHLILCFILGVHGKYPNRSDSILTTSGPPLFLSSKSCEQSGNLGPSNLHIEATCGIPSLFLDFDRGWHDIQGTRGCMQSIRCLIAVLALARLQPSAASDSCSCRWCTLYHLIQRT
jgi:hypothetical protein